MGADGDLRETYRQITEHQLEFEGETWEDKSDLSIDLTESMLSLSRDKRPTATAALIHPWLLQVNLEEEETSEMNDSDEGEEGGYSCYAQPASLHLAIRSKCA